MHFRDRISNAPSNQVLFWAEFGDTTISPAASFVLGIHFVNFKILWFAVPIWPDRWSKTHVGKVWIEFSENVLTCGLKEGIKAVRMLKIRPHGSSMAWSYSHLKILVPIRFYVHIQISLIYSTLLAIARASRPNKQREAKPSTHSTFSWHTSKLSSLILWNARGAVSHSWFCLERAHPAGYRYLFGYTWAKQPCGCQLRAYFPLGI